MFRSLPTRALLSAPLAAVLLTASAFAATPAATAGEDHRGEILVESWSLPTPSAAAGGTGKTLSAQVLASDLGDTAAASGGRVSHTDFSVMKSLDK